MESGFIYKKVLDWKCIQICESEVYRYLGYQTLDIESEIKKDERTAAIVTETINELHRALLPQVVYAEYPIHLNQSEQIDLGFTMTSSHNLYTNLKDCNKIILFAATIGPRVDILIQKYSKMNPLKGVIMQAAGAMFIESFCDLLNIQWNQENSKQGFTARPRFSPGYGDFPLETQKSIFLALSCPQKIGLTLMDTMIMAPGKSVTAVIGYQKTTNDIAASAGIDSVNNNKVKMEQHRCRQCQLTECEFRQKGLI